MHGGKPESAELPLLVPVPKVATLHGVVPLPDLAALPDLAPGPDSAPAPVLAGAQAAVPGRAARRSSSVEGSPYCLARQLSSAGKSGPIGRQPTTYRAVCSGVNSCKDQGGISIQHIT
ncbi:g8587 [Coccomyxa elongata]